MICFPGERGTTRHGSSQNGIVGVQPYSLSFSNREYSSLPAAGSSPSSVPPSRCNGSTTTITTTNNNNNNSSSAPIFDVDMKRSYAEDSQKSSSCTSSMPAPKIAHTASATAIDSAAPKFSTSVATNDLKPSNSRNGSIRKSQSDCEVFLGGSCNPTSWRTDIAIPMLKKAGITYFNPQVENWYPELMEKEHYAKLNASLLFFVIDNQTRGVAAMAEVAYLVASGKKVILVITGFKGPGQLIMDEPISQSEYEDLTGGQLLLQDLVERHDIPVFNDINTALKCTAKVVHDQLRPQDLLQVAADLVQPAFNTNTNVKIWVCSNLKQTFEKFDSARNGEISLSDVANAWKLLTNGKLGPEVTLSLLNKFWTEDNSSCKQNGEKGSNGASSSTKNGKTLNYEEFCRVIAELILCRRSTNRTRLQSFIPHGSKGSQSIAGSGHSPKSPKAGNNSGNKSAEIQRIPQSESSDSANRNYDVYLGGPCDNDNDKWRTDVAIPLLSKHNLSYSVAETSSLTRKLLTPLNTKPCDNSRVLLFHLNKSSRAVEFIIQVAYYLGLKREVVVCVENLDDDFSIKDEVLTKTAVKDYNRARSYVSDMAKRDEFPVFQNLSEALECVVEKCKRQSQKL